MQLPESSGMLQLTLALLSKKESHEDLRRRITRNMDRYPDSSLFSQIGVLPAFAGSFFTGRIAPLFYVINLK